MKDLVVVLPGIMGSTLWKDGAPVWDPSLGAAIDLIRTFGKSVRDLQLPDGIGDESPGDGVVPVDLMPDVTVLPGIWTANLGYSKLIGFLHSRFHLIEAGLDEDGVHANLLQVPYDWRLSNRFNGRRLKRIVEPALEKWRSQDASYADAKIVFVCHSMGGLVARWYIDREGGAELTRKLITLGTPHRGAFKALDQLCGGVRYGIGPLAVDLTEFARSLPSLHQLLPRYGCVELGGESGLLDLAEVRTPPGLDGGMVDDAVRFHDQLDEAWSPDAFDFHPMVGFRQPTEVRGRIVGDRLVGLETMVTSAGDTVDVDGDGTVPSFAAIPKGIRVTDPRIQGVAETHLGLPGNDGVLDSLEFVLGARDEEYKTAGRVDLRVEAPEFALASEEVEVFATPLGDPEIGLQARIFDEAGQCRDELPLRKAGDRQRAVLNGTGYRLAPGMYRLGVKGIGPREGRVAPVEVPLLLWPEA